MSGVPMGLWDGQQNYGPRVENQGSMLNVSMRLQGKSVQKKKLLSSIPFPKKSPPIPTDYMFITQNQASTRFDP